MVPVVLAYPHHRERLTYGMVQVGPPSSRSRRGNEGKQGVEVVGVLMPKILDGTRLQSESCNGAWRNHRPRSPCAS